MKLITLNVWGGRLKNKLTDFFKEHAEIDIFCLQEVYHEAQGKDVIWKEANLETLKELKEVLPEHDVYYHPHLGDWWGLAMFVKKHIAVHEVGESFVHLYKGHNLEQEVLGHTAKNIQYAKLEYDNAPLTVINFHGLWNGQGKTDCEERIQQSKKVAAFVEAQEGEVILCGDFNLLPDTESIQIIEATGLRNLISEQGITSTRTSYYQKQEKFADYMFVSKGLAIKDFSVLQHEVSDHAPLYIEI